MLGPCTISLLPCEPRPRPVLTEPGRSLRPRRMRESSPPGVPFMTAVVTPSIDEDIWEDVWDEERSWREEHAAEQAPPPLALVIFGATGDLAHRKLIPALYSLSQAGLLPERMAILGFGRSDRSDDRFREGLRRAVEES